MVSYYCRRCGRELSRISLEEVKDVGYADDEHIHCKYCMAIRSDDTPAERIAVMVDAIHDLEARINHVSKLVDVEHKDHASGDGVAIWQSAQKKTKTMFSRIALWL